MANEFRAEYGDPGYAPERYHEFTLLPGDIVRHRGNQWARFLVIACMKLWDIQGQERRMVRCRSADQTGYVDYFEGELELAPPESSVPPPCAPSEDPPSVPSPEGDVKGPVPADNEPPH